MSNPSISRDLQQFYNTPSVNLEMTATTSRNPVISDEGKAKSTISTLGMLLGVCAFITGLGYSSWLVFWSAAEIARFASFYDFVRCFCY